ncbi:MAG TPA: hypothetical protein VKR53_14350, partial [Puia sp.]|nr:hypothetical protein [Puia sp.]
MKKIIIPLSIVILISAAQAQQKSGTVIYERVSQFTRRFNINGVENEAPQIKNDKFELSFGNNQSL